MSRLALTLLGLGAVIIGILAMHVWMSGHGPSAHGAVISTSPMTTVNESRTSTAGSHTGPENEAHLAVQQGQIDPGVLIQGCVVSCGIESSALGLCVLAVIVVTGLALLISPSRALPETLLLRGPTLIRLRPQSIQIPSLIHLCISRT